MSVLDDIDLEPRATGVLLPGEPRIRVGWAEVRDAVAGDDPAGTVARARLATLLRLRRWVADLGTGAAAALEAAAVPLALPRAHALHPGPAWVAEALPGGALDLGVGVEGRLVGREHAVPLPASVALAAGADVAAWWPFLRARAESMGRLAAARLTRTPPRTAPRTGPDPDAVLRPVGGCDVPTLLASPSLRGALAMRDGSGLRAVAVPQRSRGWHDVTRVDPAYVTAVWGLTDDVDRGLAGPVLVTRDEVCLPAPGGDAVRHALEPSRR